MFVHQFNISHFIRNFSLKISVVNWNLIAKFNPMMWWCGWFKRGWNQEKQTKKHWNHLRVLGAILLSSCHIFLPHTSTFYVCNVTFYSFMRCPLPSSSYRLSPSLTPIFDWKSRQFPWDFSLSLSSVTIVKQ